MSVVNGSVDNILGGVSQQPPLLRDPSQAAEQINGWSSTAHGLIKRPPTVHVEQLENSPTGFGDAADFTIRRDADTTDRVIIKNGGIIVVDSTTGAARTVATDDTAYLTTSDPVKNIRAVTVGDATFIANRAILTKMTTAKSPNITPGCIVTIKSVDFSTIYGITLSTKPGIVEQASEVGLEYTPVLAPVITQWPTPPGDYPDVRSFLSTDYIANILYTLLTGNATLTAIYSFSLIGSSIFIQRKDGDEFMVHVFDSLGDTGIGAVKNQTQNFSDLPGVAPEGYMVNIVGNPDSPYDDYWVTFDSVHTVNGRGVWRETVAPNMETTLDPATMPHVLQQKLQRGFTMQDTTAPDSNINTAPQYEAVKTDSRWNGSVPVTKTVTLTSDGDSAYAYLPSGANKDARVTMNFKVDARSMAADNTLTIAMQFETGIGTGVFTTKASWILGSPIQTDGSQYMDVTVLSNTNQKVNVVLSYDTAPGTAKAIVTLNAQAFGGKSGLSYQRIIGTIVSMNPEKLPLLNDAHYVAVNGHNSATVGHDTAEENIAALQTSLTTLGVTYGFVVIPLTTTAFAIQYTSLATSGIPTVTIGTASPSLFGAFITYDPTLNLTLDYTGATVTETNASGTPTGFTGSVLGNNAYSLMVGYSAGSPTSGSKYVIGDLTSYTFGQATWRDRECGDETTNPIPSFVGRYIQDVFFARGRLGFLADDRVVLSSGADLFNFWRQTALQLLDDDLIDVENANQKTARFHSAVSWDGHTLLFSDLQVFELAGEPLLSPKNVKLIPLMDVESSKFVRPLAQGRRVFIPRHRATDASISQVVELTKDPVADGSALVDTTINLPSYMEGAPIAITGDDGAGLVFLLTDSNKVYVHSYNYAGGTKTLNSWSKWDFPNATVLGMDMNSGILSLVVSRSDGIFLETIDLTQAPTGAVTHQDRQGWGGGTEQYQFKYTFSPIYPTRILRDWTPHRDLQGKLQLRFLYLTYVGTRGFTLTTTNPGRATRTFTFTSATDASGSQRIGILGKNTDVTLEITDNGDGPTGFSGFSWEATYHTRSQRLS